MKFIRKVSGLILLWIIVNPAAAQESKCNFRKSFPAPRGTFLNITNKYGEIKITSSGRDSITVCAIITVKQADPGLSEKNISLIASDMNKEGDTIYIRTSFDSRFFTSAYNKGRAGFSVDYAITVPARTNLRINNSFGDVFLDVCDGYVDAKVSHGNFNAVRLSRGNEKPINSVYTDFGILNIEEANWMAVTTRNSPLARIGSARAVVISSQFSKIETGAMNSLVCDSKSDSYNIESVKNLVLESIYSSFDLGIMSGQLIADTRYGSFNVSNILGETTMIDLKSYRTPVHLGIQKGASFRTDISATGTPVDLPMEENSLLKMSTVNRITQIKGIWGSNQNTSSVLKISAEAGNLRIN